MLYCVCKGCPMLVLEHWFNSLCSNNSVFVVWPSVYGLVGLCFTIDSLFR